MLKTLSLSLIFSVMAAPLWANADSIKPKKHIPSPRCMVCTKGRACGDSCTTKKPA